MAVRGSGTGFNPASVAITGGTVAVTTLTVSGLSTVKQGSNAAPSLVFSGSPTTGFYGSAADTIDVSIGTTNTWRFTAGGAFIAPQDNSFDIGASGATRPRTGYFGTSLIVPTLGAAGSFTAIVGSNTNDSAAAGNVGEFITATAAAAAVNLSTGTTATVTSVNLTAGDWDVWGVIDLQFNAATSYSNLEGGISTTAATLSATLGNNFDFEIVAQVPLAAFDQDWVVPMVRVSISITTTVYLVINATFTNNTLKAGGVINARRAR